MGQRIRNKDQELAKSQDLDDPLTKGGNFEEVMSMTKAIGPDGMLTVPGHVSNPMREERKGQENEEEEEEDELMKR